MKKVIIAILILAVAAAVVIFFVLPEKGEGEPPTSTYVPGEFFVTNVKGSTSLLKVTVVIETNKPPEDEEFKALLTENNHIIRNTIVFVLRGKDADYLRAEDVEQSLAQELTKALNDALQIDNITKVWLSDYVIQ